MPLLDELTALSNPEPVLNATGEDDDLLDVTRARIGEYSDETSSAPAVAAGPSKLRTANAPSLADVDSRYEGKKVSRSSLFAKDYELPETSTSAKKVRLTEVDSDEADDGDSDADQAEDDSDAAAGSDDDDKDATQNDGKGEASEGDEDEDDVDSDSDGQEDLRGWRDKKGGPALVSKPKVDTNPDTADPVQMTREWLQLQRQRKEQIKKANIDTRASKGRKVFAERFLDKCRKIRYEVYKKMLNFMAPVDNCPMTDEAIDELYGSLFMKH